jgi:hypothetical protein
MLSRAAGSEITVSRFSSKSRATTLTWHCRCAVAGAGSALAFTGVAYTIGGRRVAGPRGSYLPDIEPGCPTVCQKA